jgi:hypothetical protein
MSLNGYTYCARNNVDLNTILDQIKDNLRKEQKTVLEMNCVTMHRILSPIQTALFLVESYPAHCDCLALANILAAQLKRNNSNSNSGNSSGSNGNSLPLQGTSVAVAGQAPQQHHSNGFEPQQQQAVPAIYGNGQQQGGQPGMFAPQQQHQQQPDTMQYFGSQGSGDANAALWSMNGVPSSQQPRQLSKQESSSGRNGSNHGSGNLPTMLHLTSSSEECRSERGDSCTAGGVC